jgi:hypothetical protein
MHVHQAMVNVVGNDLRNAKIMFKTGIDAYSGAVSHHSMVSMNDVPTKDDTEPHCQDKNGDNILLFFTSYFISRIFNSPKYFILTQVRSFQIK